MWLEQRVWRITLGLVQPAFKWWWGSRETHRVLTRLARGRKRNLVNQRERACNGCRPSVHFITTPSNYRPSAFGLLRTD